MKIKTIRRLNKGQKKYDIQVANNHNFFANDILVHNCTMYNDHIHARSINSDSHESRNWVKGLWSQINYMLDDNLRICGENLYAKHSLHYDNLTSYFNLFSVWFDMTCLNWHETTEYADLLGLEIVPVLYFGPYNKDVIIREFEEYDKEYPSEGYVIRIVNEFKYSDFRKCVGKYVKPEFRQVVNNSHGHWISKKVEPNKLKV